MVYEVLVVFPFFKEKCDLIYKIINKNYVIYFINESNHTFSTKKKIIIKVLF